MGLTSMLTLCFVLLATIELPSVSATFDHSLNYFKWKETCFSKDKNRPSYEEKRPSTKSYKGSVCSEGGACDNLPCGLDDFGECPCVKDDNFDDEGIPFKQNHDFDNDDDDDDADRRKKRSSSEYYDGSYTDRKGYLVKWKWYNSRKYYWFYDNYNVKKTFYIRDSKRCYYYYKDNELYQYYLENDKRHYYGTRDSSYSDSSSSSSTYSSSGSSSSSSSSGSSNSSSSSGSSSSSSSSGSSSSSSSSGSSNSSSSSASSGSSSSGSSGSSSSSGGRNRCDSGAIGGPKGYRKVCLAFRDADSIKAGYKIGYRQECLRGQDRCVIEKDKNGKYHRHCDYRSHCEKLNLKPEHCVIAGCKLFGCKASDCPVTSIFGDFFSYEKDGTKCSCNIFCNANNNCCSDVCDVCGSKSPLYSQC